MQRYRTCDSPAPSNGGRDCATKGLGPTMESKACSLIACPRKSRVFMCCFNRIILFGVIYEDFFKVFSIRHNSSIRHN